MVGAPPDGSDAHLLDEVNAGGGVETACRLIECEGLLVSDRLKLLDRVSPLVEVAVRVLGNIGVFTEGLKFRNVLAVLALKPVVAGEATELLRSARIIQIGLSHSSDNLLQNMGMCTPHTDLHDFGVRGSGGVYAFSQPADRILLRTKHFKVRDPWPAESCGENEGALDEPKLHSSVSLVRVLGLGILFSDVE